VLSTRYGTTVVQIRGVKPQIPTLFRVRPASGRSVARLLHLAHPFWERTEIPVALMLTGIPCQ
jgi:hypothetical protein